MNRSTLSRWLLSGEWQAHRTQAAVAIIAIALGVALGFSIHLINAAAFNEFSAAARSISGQSDLQVRGPQATFDESLYPSPGSACWRRACQPRTGARRCHS